MTEEIKEIWKDIQGYEGKYQISNIGRVKSLFLINRQTKIPREKILAYGYNQQGYPFVQLSKNGKIGKHLSIHRLVAMHFIPNPNNYPVVNHINGIKTDNRVENLEWCTYSRNNRHARELGLNKGVSYKTRCLKALEYIEKYKYDYEVKERGLHMIQSVVPEFRLSEILKGQITKAQCEKLLQGGDE